MAKPDEAPDPAPRILAVVTAPLDGMSPGDPITDRAVLRKILDGPNAGCVVVSANPK